MKILGLDKISDKGVKTRVIEVSSGYKAEEVAVVVNPVGVYPEFDLYPLAPKVRGFNSLVGVITDMDGTTTTTEKLCLQSLEFMVREITGGRVRALDKKKDYRYIIGNSTTRHIEYLLQTYGGLIDEAAFFRSYQSAAGWILNRGQDESRKGEVRATLRVLGISNRRDDFGLRVRMAVDIYYQRYHEILLAIAEKKEVRNLIEPMPDVGMFLALITGLLGEEAGLLSGELADLGKVFETRPVKIALVTSSIFYEANIVLGEIFRLLRTQIEAWPISVVRKQKLLDKFEDYSHFYDVVVTASDSNEIRLKPHRDLYSIALRQMGIPVDKFDQVLGLEDSESGLVAMRAAGIGAAVAVPFKETSDHNFEAASYILKGGLKELIVERKLFLKE